MVSLLVFSVHWQFSHFFLSHIVSGFLLAFNVLFVSWLRQRKADKKCEREWFYITYRWRKRSFYHFDVCSKNLKIMWDKSPKREKNSKLSDVKAIKETFTVAKRQSFTFVSKKKILIKKTHMGEVWNLCCNNNFRWFLPVGKILLRLWLT